MMPKNPHDVDPFESGWEGIPIARDRKKMSPEKLAILLSKQEQGSPPYILLSHELDLRIASVQSKATYAGAVAAVIGAIVGALLTALAPHYAAVLNERPCEQNMQGPISPPKPATQSPVSKRGKSLDVKSDDDRK